MRRIPVEEAQLSHNVFDQQYVGDIFVCLDGKKLWNSSLITMLNRRMEHTMKGLLRHGCYVTWLVSNVQIYFVDEKKLVCPRWGDHTTQWYFGDYKKTRRIPINQPALFFLLQWCQRETGAHKAQTSSPPEMNVQLNWHWISPIQPCPQKKRKTSPQRNKIHGTKKLLKSIVYIYIYIFSFHNMIIICFPTKKNTLKTFRHHPDVKSRKLTLAEAAPAGVGSGGDIGNR